jgi:Domain of unknown function (DUF4340)
MKVNGLLVAAVVLAGLVGALYWSNHHKPEEKAEAAVSPSPRILSLKQAGISQVEIKKNGAAAVELAREGDKWQITAPQKLAADQDAVSNLLSSVTPLNSTRLVEDKASDVSQYGLAKPALEIDLTEKNKQSEELLIGDETPTSGDLYAKLENDPRVFTIASYTKNSLDKGVDDLRDKRLITAAAAKISQVDLLANGQDMVFGRNKDQWEIVKPKPLRTDNLQVDNLVQTLTDAKMDLSATDDAKQDASAFASGTPVATAKVTTDGGVQELQVRKKKDDYYAKSSVVAGVYKVSSDTAQGLDKKLEDFRNKKLFDFGYSEPEKVEFHDGAKAYFLTKGGTDWWSGDGKKLETVSVDSFLDELRDAAASKFADSGFGKPAIEITVVSKQGKQVEKVGIAKHGDDYLAKREGGPAVYVLDKSTVEDLQKAATEIKPEAPAKNPVQSKK